MARNGVRTGGRVKGTPNKTTAEQRERAERVLKMIERDYLEDDVEKLTSGQRMQLYSDMLEYVAPKLARIQHEGQTDNNLTIRIVRGNNQSKHSS